jgi:hypothetical protein
MLLLRVLNLENGSNLFQIRCLRCGTEEVRTVEMKDVRPLLSPHLGILLLPTIDNEDSRSVDYLMHLF